MNKSKRGKKKHSWSGFCAVFLLAMFLITTFGSLSEAMAASSVPSVTYNVHVADKGWLGNVKDGATGGTTGEWNDWGRF